MGTTPSDRSYGTVLLQNAMLISAKNRLQSGCANLYEDNFFLAFCINCAYAYSVFRSLSRSSSCNDSSHRCKELPHAKARFQVGTRAVLSLSDAWQFRVIKTPTAVSTVVSGHSTVARSTVRRIATWGKNVCNEDHKSQRSSEWK